MVRIKEFSLHPIYPVVMYFFLDLSQFFLKLF